MAKSRQEVQVQEKKEAGPERSESTIPARIYSPPTDILETEDALRVVLEVPGIDKDSVDVRVEEGTLIVEGRLDLSKYEGLQPVYTEYNVGHYRRAFQLSTKIDQSKIDAQLKDGLLSLTLPKAEEAKPRAIKIT